MRKLLIRHGMQAVLGALAFVARRPGLNALTAAINTRLAAWTVRSKRIGTAKTAAELGPLWQRSFPSAKQVPIESSDGRTVIARIHTPCPLRGTGDLAACHRMMHFDRSVLAHAGGQFVVLDSQASPGRTHCRVAMRLEGEDMADLVEAHRQPAP